MRDLIVGGARFMVSDDVADALLDYAVELSSRGTVAIARFPSLVEGRSADTQLLIGAGQALMAVAVELELPTDLAGADFAAWELRRKTAVLAGHATDLDWNPDR